MKKTLLILLPLLLFCFSCKKNKPTTAIKAEYLALKGETMGTTYSVKYLDSLNRNLKAEIDQLLIEVNDEVSTYEPESYISRFNKCEKEIQYLNLLDKSENLPLHFKANLEKAEEVHANSYGFFDPTVMPVVNYWGFGYTEKRPVLDIDRIKVDSLMQYVGFKKISHRSSEDGWLYLQKEKSGVQLDFSALAKGYGVDAVALLLEKRGIKNYFVEIGGELRVKGKNPQNDWWTVGISRPLTDAAVQDIQSTIKLQNRAMATSGNYRNFYEVDGVKYAHTINAKTGLPEKNTLLSATLLAKDCMTADAYATACMTMGLEKGMEMVNNLPGVDAYFLFSDEAGKIQSKSTDASLDIRDLK